MNAVEKPISSIVDIEGMDTAVAAMYVCLLNSNVQAALVLQDYLRTFRVRFAENVKRKSRVFGVATVASLLVKFVRMGLCVHLVHLTSERKNLVRFAVAPLIA